MRFHKVFLSFFLISAFCLNMLSYSVVFAQTPSVSSLPTDVAQGITVNNLDEFISIVNKASVVLQPQINIRVKNFNSDTFGNAVIGLQGIEHCQFKYLSEANYTSLSITLDYNQVYKITQGLKNSLAYKRLTSNDISLLTTARSIIKQIISDNMTDYEKELAIHDYIINNTSYDYNNFLNNSIPKSCYTAYGVLTNKIAVCQGYSEAMKLLLNLVNIDCEIVIGTTTSGEHSWNIVKLDNDWYMVDTTWDDPILFDNNSRIETLRYDYLNITNEQMMKDHKWDIYKWPVAAGTIYNYFAQAHLIVNTYSDFKELVIREIQAGKKQIFCYVTHFDSKQYDLRFIFSYHNGPIEFLLPNTTEGKIKIILK